MTLTPKELVLAFFPEAITDYYETVPGMLYIRNGPQGVILGPTRRTAPEAWRAASNTIRERARKAFL